MKPPIHLYLPIWRQPPTTWQDPSETAGKNHHIWLHIFFHDKIRFRINYREYIHYHESYGYQPTATTYVGLCFEPSDNSDHVFNALDTSISHILYVQNRDCNRQQRLVCSTWIWQNLFNRNLAISIILATPEFVLQKCKKICIWKYMYKIFVKLCKNLCQFMTRQNTNS